MTASSDRTRARLEKALLFIEANLTSDLRVADIADHAHLSPFHFQRLFSAYLGEPVSQYVLSRRLEQAARILTERGDMNILELALESGFETHSAFTRAFKARFSVTPSAFRRSPTPSRSGTDEGRPFLIASSSGSPISPVGIVDLPEFEFQYRRSHGTLGGSFFQEQDQDVGAQFAALLEANPDPCLNILSCVSESPQSLNDTRASIWFGGAFAARADNSWSDNWYAFKAGRWAVFGHWGEYKYLYQTWNNIYRGWLSNSDLELRNEMPFEAYVTPADSRAPQEQLTKIHIPLKTA